MSIYDIVAFMDNETLQHEFGCMTNWMSFKEMDWDSQSYYMALDAEMHNRGLI